MLRLRHRWRPAWVWAGIAAVIMLGLVSVALLRGPARSTVPTSALQTTPHAWDGHRVERLTTVLTVPGPDTTTVRLVAADVEGSGPCLGVVVSVPSLDPVEGPTENSVCDASVSAVLDDASRLDGVTAGGVWQWLSRSGEAWNGYFGTTTAGAAVHLRVGSRDLASTPVTHHAYLSTASDAVASSRTCVQLLSTDARGTTVFESPVAGECPGS